MVGSQGGDNHQIDLSWRYASPLQTVDSRLVGQIASRLMVGRFSPLVDTCPLDDPLTVATQCGQVLVGHLLLGKTDPRGGDRKASK
jgi:hypothetical protein